MHRIKWSLGTYENVPYVQRSRRVMDDGSGGAAHGSRKQSPFASLDANVLLKIIEFLTVGEVCRSLLRSSASLYRALHRMSDSWQLACGSLRVNSRTADSVLAHSKALLASSVISLSIDVGTREEFLRLVQVFEQCTNLRFLTISVFLSSAFSTADYARVSAAILQNSASLCMLDLRDCNAYDIVRAAMEQLRSFRELRSLNLRRRLGLKAVREAVGAHLASCEKLVELDISRNALEASMIQLVSTLPQLRTVNLSHNPATFPGKVRAIGEVFRRCPRLQKVEIGCNGITSQELATLCEEAFPHAEKLIVLGLSNNRIYEYGARCLVRLFEERPAVLPNLRYLDLSYNAVDNPALVDRLAEVAGNRSVPCYVNGESTEDPYYQEYHDLAEILAEEKSKW